MEVLKDMRVLCGDKIINRYAYQLNNNIYVRLGKHWHEVSQSDCPMEYQYILGSQLTEIEANILEDEMNRARNVGKSFSYTPNNVSRYFR